MGMDYVGLDPKSEAGGSYHLNWSGHSYMTSLLEQIGADLGRGNWSGSNDGDEIDGQQAAIWAGLLDAAVDSKIVKNRKIKDDTYAGGYQEMPYVENPVSTAATDMLEAMKQSFGAKIGKTRIVTDEIVDLEASDAEWIKSFAAFLRDCGGAAQW